MQQTQTSPATAPTEVTILSKLLLNNHGRGLTQQQARYLLGLAFTDEDKARMHELAEKNREGKSPTPSFASWTATSRPAIS